MYPGQQPYGGYPGQPYPGSETVQQTTTTVGTPGFPGAVQQQTTTVGTPGYPGQPYPGQPYPGQPFIPGQPYPGSETVQQTTTTVGTPGFPGAVQQQTTTTAVGTPGYPGQPFPGAYPGQQPGFPGQPYPGAYPGQPGFPGQPFPGGYPGQPGFPGQPGVYPGQYPGAVQQTTTISPVVGGVPGIIPGVGGVTTTTTTTFAPQVSATFGRAVQLWNLHGKFLVSGDYKPHGHHDPHHGFHHASHWHIDPHGSFTDKVSLRGKNGKYLCHEGHSSHVRMHHEAFVKDAAWHMEFSNDGFVTFRSTGGHYLGCDEFGHEVHAWNEGPHRGQKFELRYV